MKKRLPLLAVLVTGLTAVMGTAHAGNFTISNASTTAQTLSGGQTGTVTSTGSLTVGGGTVAVTLNGSSTSLITLNNSGLITENGTGSNGGRAIRDNTGGLNVLVNNYSGATISTADGDVIQMNKASSSITFNNYGTLTSSNASAGGSQAIDFNAITTGSNTFNNYAGAIAQAAEADAVRPGVNGVVNNSGTIKATSTTGSSSDGIDAQNNSGIQITNASSVTAKDSNGNPVTTGANLIEGARHGITGGAANSTVSFTMSVTNNLGGTIQGDAGSGINIDGFNANEVVTIVNHGTITGTSTTADSDGVDVDGLVNITNTGSIISYNAHNDTSEGVTVGGGTITNSGLISGQTTEVNGASAGITLAGVDKDANDNPIPPQGIYANTVVTNTGTIKGQTGAGIQATGAANAFTITINNNAGGLIQGGGTVAVIQLGGNDDTVNNAGTIDGSVSGKAIDMGGGNNVVNITGGQIIGSISGGATRTSSTLNFDPGAGNTFRNSSNISNFDQVNVKSGATVLSGSNTYTGGTHVTGGVLLVTGSHTGGGTYLIDGGSLGGAGGTITTNNADVILSSTAGSGLNISGSGLGTVGNQHGLVTPGALTLDLGTGTLDISNAGSSSLHFALTTISGSDEVVMGSGKINIGQGLLSLANFQFDLQGAEHGTYTLFDSASADGIIGTLSSSDLQAFYGAYLLTLVQGTDGSGNATIEVQVVPEPSSYALGVIMLGVLGFCLYRRNKAQASA